MPRQRQNITYYQIYSYGHRRSAAKWGYELGREIQNNRCGSISLPDRNVFSKAG